MSIVDYLRANETRLKAMRQDGVTWEAIASLARNETGEEVNLASLRKTYSRLFGGSEAPPKVEKPQKVGIRKVERKPKAEASDDHFSGYETLSDDDLLSAPLPQKSQPKNHSETPPTVEPQEINLDVLLSSDSLGNEIMELKRIISERDAEIKSLISLKDENELDAKHPNYLNFLKAIVNNYRNENIRLFTINQKLENDLEESGLKKEIERLSQILDDQKNWRGEVEAAYKKRYDTDYKIEVEKRHNQHSIELHAHYKKIFQEKLEALEKKYKSEKKFLGVFAIN